jgi:glutamate carboxypeptidase
MVSINSYTENTEGVNRLGAYTAALFEGLGFSAESVLSADASRGSHLVCVRKGKGSGCAALVSHLDTVYPPEEEKERSFYFHVEGDRVYGPGTCDIKGGTLVMYMMMECLKEEYADFFYSHSWYLLFNASEETDSSDFMELCTRVIPPNAKAALVFEAGSSFGKKVNIITARKGRAVFRIESEGRGAHAGSAHHAGINAIVRLCKVINHLTEFTEYSKGITVNTGVIGGGNALNRVPDFAFADVEMRAFAPDAFNETIERIKSLTSRNDGLLLNVKLIRTVQPWPVNTLSENLYRIWADAADGLGIETLPEQRGGLSDGNLLWTLFPVIDGLGPAGSNAHSSAAPNREFAVLTDFVPKTVLNMLGLIRLMET